MPHKCLRCGRVYEDFDPAVMRGCECGSPFFIYFKSEEDLKKWESVKKKLREKKTTLEKEIKRRIKRSKLETVRMPEEGVYEIDIEALMEEKPLKVFEKGVAYVIHLPSVFEKVRR